MAKPKDRKAIIRTLAVILCVTATILCLISAQRDFVKLREIRSAKSSNDFVRIVDVGQGDSILIHSGGYSALIDTGPKDNADELTQSLKAEGIEIIDVLLLTHLHVDHTGGIEQVFSNFKVETLILPELSTFSDGIYSAEFAINQMTQSGGNIYKAVENMSFDIGNFKITVIGAYYDIFDENNRSLIVKAENSGQSFLLTGDAETKTEKRLLEDEKDIDCDVLKVGHHGSTSSSINDFLDKVSPVYAAISVGTGNMYNHPHLDTLKRLEMRGIKTYRTDHSGDITFYVEKGKINPQTEK